jgi:hypothetical protein
MRRNLTPAGPRNLEGSILHPLCEATKMSITMSGNGSHFLHKISLCLAAARKLV